MSAELTFFWGLILLFSSLAITNISAPDPKKAYEPSKIWKDTNGNPINAHGAGILEHQGTFYLFGEIKKGRTWLVPNQNWECYRVQASGISCYSSRDLVNWQYEGVALAPNTTNPKHDLHLTKVIERPKVIYNQQTKKFVMWMHVDSETYGYSQAGVAVSDRPTGPFTYLGSVKPNGNMARDLTVFKDDDEKAYLIFASEMNKTLHITLLSGDYLQPTSLEKRILKNQAREAPAVFKYQHKYFLITSACTGWSPNPATYAVADALLGEWRQMGNPCVGPNAETTFQSQSTFILPMPSNKDAFIFMADRWNKTDLENSQYVWLTLKMQHNQPQIRWENTWHL